MKNIKKIGALLLALVMVLSLSATALAEDATLSGDGIVGDFTTPDNAEVQEGTVLIYKEIKAYNEDANSVYAPVVDFTYTIAPGSPDKDIYDIKTAHDPQTNVHVQTKAGLAGATISGSVDNGTTYVANKLAFTNSVEFTTSADGASNKYPLKLDFSGVTWTDAGVYRYVVTETITAADKKLAGIADGTVSETRYVDVYVKRGDTAGQYEIYGYTCFAYDNKIDARDAADAVANDVVAKAYKNEGFVAGTNTNTNAAETADAYYTFDLTISKTLVGDAAMNSHKFPFEVDMTNASVTATIKLKQTTVAGGGITAAEIAPAAVSNLDKTDLEIANGASITYIGIPVGIDAATNVKVKEKNDVVGTTYESKYALDTTDEDTINATRKNIANNEYSNIADLTISSANAHDSASAHEIAFTNTLRLISPTGVALRVAPFALILVGGIFLLILARRRREEAEEA